MSVVTMSSATSGASGSGVASVLPSGTAAPLSASVAALSPFLTMSMFNTGSSVPTDPLRAVQDQMLRASGGCTTMVINKCNPNFSVLGNAAHSVATTATAAALHPLTAPAAAAAACAVRSSASSASLLHNGSASSGGDVAAAAVPQPLVVGRKRRHAAETEDMQEDDVDGSGTVPGLPPGSPPGLARAQSMDMSPGVGGGGVGDENSMTARRAHHWGVPPSHKRLNCMTEEELALRLATYESPMSSRNPDAERSRLAAAQEREQAAAAVAASNILATDVSVSKQAYLQELLTLMGTIRAERDKFHDEARVLKKAFAALYAKKTQLDALVSQKAASEAALVDEVEMLRQENAKLRMMCQSMHLPYGRSSQFDDFNPGAMAF